MTTEKKPQNQGCGQLLLLIFQYRVSGTTTLSETKPYPRSSVIPRQKRQSPSTLELTEGSKVVGSTQNPQVNLHMQLGHQQHTKIQMPVNTGVARKTPDFTCNSLKSQNPPRYIITLHHSLVNRFKIVRGQWGHEPRNPNKSPTLKCFHSS